MTAFSRRKILAGGAGALAAASIGSVGLQTLARGQGQETRKRVGVAFGTTVALTFAGPDAATLDEAIARGFAEIRSLEAAASLSRPDSALSRLNRDGRLAAPPPKLLALTRFALDLAEASGGAFDPTVQPLWPLWRDAIEAGRRPAAADLARTVALIDWRSVRVSDDMIAFGRPGVAMTLNGVLQGYGADLVIAAAQRLGVPNAFVDTGEFGAYGRAANGAPWRLGVATRDEPDRPYLVDDHFSGFAATSAGAGTPFSRDGADNHLFDPRTGASPHLVEQTSAFAPSGALADGLSTAAYVMGEPAGRALAERFGGSLSVRPAAT